MEKNRQLKAFQADTFKSKAFAERFFAGILALLALAGGYIFYKRKTSVPTAPGKKLDIEIRYETEKDADATLLAQNLVKILRIVLSPLERAVQKEDAKLVFVYGGDYWEMRVRNGSDRLKQSVRSLLEAREW